MLSIFPNLFTYWMVAPVILRATLGLTFIHEAYRERKTNRVLALAKVLAGICLLIGFLTQIGGLLGIIISARELWLRRGQSDTDRPYLKLAVAVALLFLGPGFFSIDLPL